jgi:hypothetical protein
VDPRRGPVAEPPHVQDLHQDARLREHRVEEPAGQREDFQLQAAGVDVAVQAVQLTYGSETAEVAVP